MKKLSYHLFAFITILCWAPTFPVNRMLAPYFQPASLGFLRYGLAAILLGMILIIRKTPLPAVRDLPLCAAAALFGFSLYMIVFNKGTGMLPASTSSVIIAMVPVVTNIIASIIFREKLKTVLWFAVGVEFVGIVILTLAGNSFTLNQGVLWMLLCVIMFASYNILQRGLSKKYPAFTISAVCILFGEIELLWAAPAGLREFSAAPTEMKLWVILLGIFPSALAYVTWTYAFSLAANTSQVVNYMFITPFLATLIDFVLNHEIPTLTTVVGGSMIILGAILFNRNQ